jgi:hypothetical protein
MARIPCGDLARPHVEADCLYAVPAEWPHFSPRTPWPSAPAQDIPLLRKPYRASGSPTGRPFSLWPWPRHPSPMAGKDRDEIAWLDIEVAGWPAGRAFDLEEFAVPGKIAESYWAMWRW